VGDPDQNIYRFQGSYTEIFDDFKSTYPNAKEVFLTENYRNPQHVINFATDVIGQDAFRTVPPAPFHADKPDDTKVNIVECQSELVQAEFVKNKIAELRKNCGYKWSDFAILSRKQRDGLNVAQLLVSEGVPTRYTGKADIHTSSKAKLVFSILRIIADPMNSMISINRVLQEYGISEINISRINLEATKRARNRDDGDHCLEVISDIISSAYDLESINRNATVSDFLDFIEHLIKFDVETNRGEDDDDAVQVSTVHQSKGLEYKVVFVIDVATRKFPLKWNEKMFYVPAEISNSKQPASGDPKQEFLREERRILYVGMTRAEDHLFVTYPVRYSGNVRGHKESKYLQDVKPRASASGGGWAAHPDVNFI
jgi:superfamily I DNA/RNA helicase